MSVGLNRVFENTYAVNAKWTTSGKWLALNEQRSFFEREIIDSNRVCRCSLVRRPKESKEKNRNIFRGNFIRLCRGWLLLHKSHRFIIKAT